MRKRGAQYLVALQMSWADLKAPGLELGPWKALHNTSCLGMEVLTVLGPVICSSRIINSVFKGLAVSFPHKHTSK